MKEKEPNQEVERAYEKISPTAYGVARARTFTDIPFSKEIFEEVDAEVEKDPNSSVEVYGLAQLTELTPFFEARYLIINKLLEKEGAEQIIELASGLSPRGLEFTANPNISYAELDLPDLIAQKRDIVQNITNRKELGKRQNLYLEGGNALNLDDLNSAASHFDPQKKLSVINEGLLRYLSHDEKKQLASGIKSLLQKFGGTWITPDIGLQGRRRIRQTDSDKESDAKMAKATGVADFEANYFADEATAKVFFEDLGFDVEVHNYQEVESQLVSPQKLHIDSGKVEDILNWQVAFAMTLKNQ